MSGTRWMWCGGMVMFALGLVASGCDRPPGEPVVVDRERTAGAWVELGAGGGDAGGNPRAGGGETGGGVHRKLQINADGTYVLELVDKGGKSLGKAEGNWRVENDFVMFDVSANNLPANHQGAAPERSRGWTQRYDETNNPVDGLTILDQSGSAYQFERPR